MKIKLISVGDELLSEKVNTNLLSISSALRSIGIEISSASTVGDSKDKISKEVKLSLNDFDVVIVTGGLGPTFDDVTREGVAEALNEKLLFSKEVESRIKRIFEKKGGDIPSGVMRQALVFENSQIIENKFGTAPGLIIERNDKLLILLPGPPSELNPMLKETVVPLLSKKLKKKDLIIQKTLLLSGILEANVNEKLETFIRKIDDVKFSILPSEGVVKIKMKLATADFSTGEDKLRRISKKIYEMFGNNIFGENDDTLEAKIGRLLLEKGKSIAIAESCSGGLISDKITNIPGSSRYFLGAVVAYSNESKINLLGVRPSTIENYGAVSKESCLEMAKGVRIRFNSDIGVSVTGIAGPSGGSKEKPVGLVYFGYSDDEGEDFQRFVFSGERVDIKKKSYIYLLDFLRRKLI